MTSAQQGSSSSSANAVWNEPPWSGWIETTYDALLILEAARRGLIPRVTRRLVDAERKMICSGSVFVFDEDESGIKRWTDGFYWSPSRILGNFLLYRETDKRGVGGRNKQQPPDVEVPDERPDNSLSRPRVETQLSPERQRERNLYGSLTNSYKFKQDGLMKKTFSLTINGVAQHLISYYKIDDVEAGRLRKPSSLPELASLQISPEYLDKTHFRNPPKTEVDADGILRYRGEADDIDPGSPTMITGPSSLLSEGQVTEGSRRSQRYDPYKGGSGKRRSKAKADSESPESPPASPPPPPNPQAQYQQDPATGQYYTPYFPPAPPGYAPYPGGGYPPPPPGQPGAPGAWAYPPGAAPPGGEGSSQHYHYSPYYPPPPPGPGAPHHGGYQVHWPYGYAHPGQSAAGPSSAAGVPAGAPLAIQPVQQHNRSASASGSTHNSVSPISPASDSSVEQDRTADG